MEYMSDANSEPNETTPQRGESNEHSPTTEQAHEDLRGEDAFANVSDLDEAPGETVASASSFEHTSDALYIVREANYLFELDEALEEANIELKEEVE
jgi:hypothetical protein